MKARLRQNRILAHSGPAMGVGSFARAAASVSYNSLYVRRKPQTARGIGPRNIAPAAPGAPVRRRIAQHTRRRKTALGRGRPSAVVPRGRPKVGIVEKIRFSRFGPENDRDHGRDHQTCRVQNSGDTCHEHGRAIRTGQDGALSPQCAAACAMSRSFWPVSARALREIQLELCCDSQSCDLCKLIGTPYTHNECICCEVLLHLVCHSRLPSTPTPPALPGVAAESGAAARRNPWEGGESVEGEARL